MKFVQFVLLREGTSDDGLLSHLEELLIEAGVEEALGETRPLSGSSDEKLAQLAATDSHVGLVFIHRDADNVGAEVRRKEIRDAAAHLPDTMACVPVVPVTMTESWLLLDVAAIRRVAGNEFGSMRLATPTAANVEFIADAKSRLKALLAEASGLSGSRLAEFRRRFPDHRRQLLSGLDRRTDIRLVPSFKALAEDIETFVASLRG